MHSIIISVGGCSKEEVKQTIFAIKHVAKTVTRRTKGGWKVVRHGHFIELKVEDDTEARILTKMLNWAASGI